MTNRWFTNNGRAKRIAKEFEQFRVFATCNKSLLVPELRLLELIKNVRNSWPQLGLAEATNLTVYIVGIYDNDKVSMLFREERYLLGALVAKEIRETVALCN